MEQPEAAPAPRPPEGQAERSPRKRTLGRLVAVVVVVVGVAGALAWWLRSRKFEDTDDAQVDGDIVNLSPKVAGTLLAVHVVDNQWVEVGTPIADIDPADLKVAVAQAKAAVAQAEAAHAIAQRENARAQHLIKVDAITAEERDRRASLNASTQASIEQAQAQLAQAELNLSYAHIVAPVRGIITKKSIAAGDHVAPGQQLLAISQVDHLWVTANFRETQLRRLRPGMQVRVHVDALGTSLHGTIASFGGATGARFSVLPPENAAGNYVKVVQRIPVRIELDAGQPGLDRLRPGMSVEPRVRVG